MEKRPMPSLTKSLSHEGIRFRARSGPGPSPDERMGERPLYFPMRVRTEYDTITESKRIAAKASHEGKQIEREHVPVS